jgi:hypothetical protein
VEQKRDNRRFSLFSVLEDKVGRLDRNKRTGDIFEDESGSETGQE